jgi:uncharacterized damage-inducible protein DinB
MRTVLTLLLAAALAPSAAAQTPSANPVSDAIRSSWNGVKRNISESAEQMPEANYAFKPVDTVRSFGEILAHVAGANYVFCASAKGEKPPFAEDAFEKSATTKAAIVKAVADSHAYCDGAYTAVTDATAGQMVNNPFGSGQSPRAAQLIGNVGHDNEHYGNLVTYFRLKGMVPPSSKRQ